MSEATVNLLVTYREAVAAKPNSSAARANLGMGYYGAKRYEEALPEFQAALKLDRNNVDAYYGLGLTLKASGEKKEAIEAFEKAIALAGRLSDEVKGQMLMRLAQGQINEIKTGDWGLTK